MQRHTSCTSKIKRKLGSIHGSSLLSRLPSGQTASRFRCSFVEISGSVGRPSGRRHSFITVVFWTKKNLQIFHSSPQPSTAFFHLSGLGPSIYFCFLSLHRRKATAGFQRRLFFVRRYCSLKSAFF